MAGINGVDGATSAGTDQRGDRMNSLDTDAFLKLMIAEMQNQDPLDPMDNTKMLEQISQIRNISASDKMNSTLQSVMLGQNISSANALIGKEVNALSIDNTEINGTVSRVSIVDNVPFLTIGTSFAKLSNVWGIQEPGAGEQATPPAETPEQ